MSETPALESLLRRDRWIVGSGLAIICLISWGYVLSGAGTGMSAASMSTWKFPPPAMSEMMHTDAVWSVNYWVTMVFMWWVMMIAMMVPSASPMILLHARVFRHGQKNRQIADGAVPTPFFLLGYLIAWLCFSIGAATLQWAFERSGLLHGMMMWSTSTVVSSAFLLAAGVYQFSPLKQICLKHCRSPADFLSRHWRNGRLGTFRLGVHHGIYCVGCCWVLMALLFAGGVMNLFWIAGLAILVLLEKFVPQGVRLARISGVALIAAGVWVLVRQIF